MPRQTRIAMPKDDLDILAPPTSASGDILTKDARAFVARLVREYGDEIELMLARRRTRQTEFDAGALPDFDATTRTRRDADWRVAPLPKGLEKRVVEITGPPERRMIVHALNSGADVFMADFEDATSPTWSNLISGQRNVRDAANGTIEAVARDGTRLTLGPMTAKLMVRPRGLHLPEAHVRWRGRTVAATLFDLGLFAWHSSRALLERGEVPSLYVPKLEGFREAALFNELLASIERELGLDSGALKVTVLIETLPAAFEMDEILDALRSRALGLNCGRWDYMFSYVKTLRHHPDRLLPDREALSMTQPFLANYARLLVQTCHRRGALALGGMAAQIPVRHDPVANEAALDAVRKDKQREAREGHDGTWVAHPSLVGVARRAFDEELQGRVNQLEQMREDIRVGPEELLAPAEGPRTEGGLRESVGVALEYLAAWLSGSGCVPIDGKMEDAATAEIARALVWQAVRHGASTDDGRVVSGDRIRALVESAEGQLAARLSPASKLREACELVLQLMTDTERFAEFSTLPAYAKLFARDACPPTAPPMTKEQTA